MRGGGGGERLGGEAKGTGHAREGGRALEGGEEEGKHHKESIPMSSRCYLSHASVMNSRPSITKVI